MARAGSAPRCSTRSRNELDFSPLARVLADPSVEVLMHAGRQDVAILRRSWNTEVTNVFDTQVAAGFLGFGNQEGYESLVRKVLRVKLKGSEGFTKWDRRPLTAQQLEYAGDDARLLLSLGQELERRLEERGRLEWAREESPARSRTSATSAMPIARTRSCRGSAGSATRPARSRVNSRSGASRRRAAPTVRPGAVLPDQALVELARRTPRAAEAAASSALRPSLKLSQLGGILAKDRAGISNGRVGFPRLPQNPIRADKLHPRISDRCRRSSVAPPNDLPWLGQTDFVPRALF